MRWQLINHQDSPQELYLIPRWYPRQSSAATDARKRERAQKKKKNDLHKSIIHRESSAAVMLAARLHGSILAPADSPPPRLISAVAASPFILRKMVSDFFFPSLLGSLGGEDIDVQFCACNCEQMSPADPLKLLGSSPLRGLTLGRRALVFPRLRISSKRTCSLFPRESPSLTLTPAFTIAVDVMTQNKQHGGVRPPFVWGGRSPPSPLCGGRISPVTMQSLPPSAHSSWQVPEHEPQSGSDVKESRQTRFVSRLAAPVTDWTTCQSNSCRCWQGTARGEETACLLFLAKFYITKVTLRSNRTRILDSELLSLLSACSRLGVRL